MSYLGPLRLHFAGRFQASVSTVNNTPTNWDNDGWTSDNAHPGGFDPGGDAAWRLIGCRITSAWHADGTPVTSGDPVLTCTVADSDTRVAAKLVDLDSEQQMVSMIFGLEVRIVAPDGTTVVSGRFDPAPFTDLWQRWSEGGGDPSFGACYQSVLTDLQWGAAAAGSAFLREVRAGATDGLLSIKFNVDGYQADSTVEDYTRGRIVGTIGPQSASEPRQMIVGRRLLSSPYAFAASINQAWAVVDADAGKVYVDLGNSLPTESSGGGLIDQGPLDVAAGATPIGEITGYAGQQWYAKTAGIVALPQTGTLDSDQLAAIAQTPIEIASTTNKRVSIRETPMGLYARADEFVFRLDAGESADVRVVAMRFGRPHAHAEVLVEHDDSQLQADPADPPVGKPARAVRFPASVTTGDDGIATFTITTSDPGNPRSYIDGQVYGVRPVLADAGQDYPTNPWDYVSLHVYEAFDVAEPAWFPDLQPVFAQYAFLYPVMRPIVDLSSYESVCANRLSLRLAFGLDFGDPNYMPVTRDLSKAKQAAILGWLGQDPPPLGTPPAEGTTEPLPVPERQADTAAGKAMAAAKLPAASGDEGER